MPFLLLEKKSTKLKQVYLQFYTILSKKEKYLFDYFLTTVPSHYIGSNFLENIIFVSFPFIMLKQFLNKLVFFFFSFFSISLRFLLSILFKQDRIQVTSNITLKNITSLNIFFNQMQLLINLSLDYIIFVYSS